jgi:hypothetical protein
MVEGVALFPGWMPCNQTLLDVETPVSPVAVVRVFPVRLLMKIDAVP